jgi:hypothetical protein
MSSTVSRSAKHDDHQLTQLEKDENCSSGAGRKAIEHKKADRDPRAGYLTPPTGLALETMNRPPIGLESETKGDDHRYDKRIKSTRLG